VYFAKKKLSIRDIFLISSEPAANACYGRLRWRSLIGGLKGHMSRLIAPMSSSEPTSAPATVRQTILTLSPEQFGALRNLALKKSGKAVGWISITEAQRLAELGLAERNRSGWGITPEGEAALIGSPVRAPGDGAILMFRPRVQQPPA